MDAAPASSRSIADDHGPAPLAADESARIWGLAGLDGLELFHGRYRKHEFSRHFHSIPAIGVVDHGSMRTYWNGSTHQVEAGSLILLNAGEVHAPGPAGEQGWSFRVFFLGGTLFQQLSEDVAGRTLHFPKAFAQDSELARTLVRLHTGLERAPSKLEAESALTEVFAQLASRHSSGPQRPPLPVLGGKRRVQRAREYIAAHYPRNISLADLSSAAGISAFHLVRSFNREIGLSPHAYLTQVRVEAAKSMLQKGLPIADVAARTGFTDQSHLTRHFKRLTGVTPSRYRPAPELVRASA